MTPQQRQNLINKLEATRKASKAQHQGLNTNEILIQVCKNLANK